jgi:Fic family protein
MCLLHLLQEEKSMRLKGGLYHQTQIKLAYNSNRIEGSKLSEDQTRYIFETNTISVDPKETANVDDIIETVNHFSCFDYMIETIAPSNVKKVIAGLLAGYLTKKTIDFAAIADFHYQFERIQDKYREMIRYFTETG